MEVIAIVQQVVAQLQNAGNQRIASKKQQGWQKTTHMKNFEKQEAGEAIGYFEDETGEYFSL